jgi:hypothetical protein
MPLQDQVDRGLQQGMAGADELGQRLARHADQVLRESDPLVPGQHRVADADLAIPVTDQGRDVGDLGPPRP